MIGGIIMAKSKPVVDAVSEAVSAVVNGDSPLATTATPKSYRDCGVIGAAVGDALQGVGEYIGSQNALWESADWQKSDEGKSVNSQILDGVMLRFDSLRSAADKWYGEFAYVDNNLVNVTDLSPDQAKKKYERVLVNVHTVFALGTQAFNAMAKSNPMLHAAHGVVRDKFRGYKSAALKRINGAVVAYLHRNDEKKTKVILNFDERIKQLFAAKDSPAYDKSKSLTALCASASTVRKDDTANVSRLNRAIDAFMKVWNCEPQKVSGK
jgi:hypothetical protein